MTKKTELLHFYNNYYNSLLNIEKENKFADKFYQALLAGDNEVYQKYISETKIFDETWIKTVESYIPSLNKIVLNPRSSIKVEEEVVAVEKARKITSQSVKHLASHTHMIKEILDDGSVRPKNILTTYTDVDYGTYENRFLMTLIERLFIFVRNRYELIKTNIESFERRRFYLKSNFPVNYTNVDVEINLTLVDEIENKEINEFNKKLLERVEYLNKIVTSLRGSRFMTEDMKDQRKIFPPIMKTNVIQRNVDFRNAYLLWLFLDRYNTLAFTTEIEEKNLSFTDKYFSDINRQILTLYSSIVANQEMNKKAYEELKSKKFRKKSIKIKRTHPDDIHLTPEDEVMEDLTLNEYYLNANKQIFKQSLDYHQETAATYETSVKRALRETLNISNALYQSFFELDEDDDIFTRLIKEVDVTKELSEARRKLLISRLIREVKEVDFNNALRQEKKFLEDIAKFDGVLLKEYEQKLELTRQEIAHKDKLQRDKQQAELEKQIVEEKLRETKYLKDEINKYRVQINKQINDYQRELNQKFKEETKQYEKELADQTKKILADYREKHAPKRRVTNEQLKEEKLIITDEFNKEKEAFLIKHNTLLKSSKASLKKESTDKINKDKQIYQEMLKNNERNLKELARKQDEYNKTLDSYKKKLEQEQKEILEEFRVKLRRDEMTKIALNRQKYRITQRITDYRLKQELQRLEARLAREKKRLKAKKEASIKKQQQKLKEASNKKVLKDELEQKQRKEENKRNTATLAKAKKEVADKIKKLK